MVSLPARNCARASGSRRARARVRVERVRAAAGERAHLVNRAALFDQERAGVVGRQPLGRCQGARPVVGCADAADDAVELGGRARRAQVLVDREHLGRRHADVLVAAMRAARLAGGRRGQATGERAGGELRCAVHRVAAQRHRLFQRVPVRQEAVRAVGGGDRDLVLPLVVEQRLGQRQPRARPNRRGESPGARAPGRRDERAAACAVFPGRPSDVPTLTLSSSDRAASASQSLIALCRRSKSARSASSGARSPSRKLMRAAGYASASAASITS